MALWIALHPDDFGGSFDGLFIANHTWTEINFAKAEGNTNIFVRGRTHSYGHHMDWSWRVPKPELHGAHWEIYSTIGWRCSSSNLHGSLNTLFLQFSSDGRPTRQGSEQRKEEPLNAATTFCYTAKLLPPRTRIGPCSKRHCCDSLHGCCCYSHWVVFLSLLDRQQRGSKHHDESTMYYCNISLVERTWYRSL